MSDLIATTHKKENELIISNEGIFPAIDVQDFTQIMRLEGAITLERKTYALQHAIASVNVELADIKFKDSVQAERQNINKDSVQAERQNINKDSVQVEQQNVNTELFYKEAVYCHAMANILQAYRSYDTTKSGAEKADSLEPNIDMYKQRHREAIRKLLHETRITVELI